MRSRYAARPAHHSTHVLHHPDRHRAADRAHQSHRRPYHLGWPQNGWSLPHELIVVKLKQSGVRQKCESPGLTEDTLTCAASHHRPPKTYNREDIAALIHPRSHEERNIMAIPVALMAVFLAGSFFVPLGWSIALRIFAFFSFCAFGAMGIGATGDDSAHDILLYQRPNTPFTIPLR